MIEKKNVVEFESENNKKIRDLNEQDYFYYMLFNNHNSMMLLINPVTGKIVEANQAAIKYYGYTEEELLSLKIQDINILDEKQIKKEMNLAKKEKRNHFEFIHLLANRERRDVEVHSFPVETKDGTMLFSIVYDISDKLKQKLMFDKLFVDSPYAVAILDKDRKIVNVNRFFTNLFQYSKEKVKGKTINDLVSPIESISQVDKNIELIYRGKIIKQEDIRKREDGKLIEVELLGYPVIYHGEVVGAYIIYIDITYKKSYEKQLLLFRKTLENNSEGVVITDNNGYIEWINNAFTEITGYTLEEVSGKKTNILKSGMHEQSFYVDMWNQLLDKGKWSGEIWNKNKHGVCYCEWLIINGIRNDSNHITHYVGVFKDLSEKKKIDRRMGELQQKDLLTGLYNRNYFLEIMDNYIVRYSEKEKKFSIVCIDIENFKEINDSLGHIIGDKLLIELSKRISSLESDNFLLSRFDSDEFAILCNDLDEENSKIFIENLFAKINEPFNIENAILYLNANIGISIFPDDGTDAETLIRYANIAMNKSRNQIERICFYSKKMSEEIEENFYIANYLVRAISNNEFYVCYQPIFDIMEKNIVGAEALLRWKSPVLGIVSPAKFIPIAEKTGQIIPVGEWVIKEVCKQINIWKNKYYRFLPIAINISVKQLEKVEFAKTVTEILKENNIKANDIEIEITESVSLGDVAKIVKNVKEFKAMGIKISMDDFGTGFSSLGQLDFFEIDKLKIDKSFIDDLVNVKKRQNLVKSIIAMSYSLNLLVIAEGIETNEQLFYLRNMGCQLGQGYLFSKPLKVEDFELLLSITSDIIDNDDLQ
jgi:diguanylate cyclase (GGDEF)-like protein/PAS domain S-box-containing protein